MSLRAVDEQRQLYRLFIRDELGDTSTRDESIYTTRRGRQRSQEASHGDVV